MHKGKISGLLCGLCLIGILALWMLKKQGIYLWLGGITTPHLSFFLACALILLFPIWLLMFFWHRIPSKLARAVFCVVLLLLLVPAVWAQGFNYAWNISQEEYQVYTSADSNYQVVVMDASYFHSAYGDVYQITSAITMQEIGSFQGEIGSQYTLQWEDDCVVITFGEKTIHFHLLED